MSSKSAFPPREIVWRTPDSRPATFFEALEEPTAAVARHEIDKPARRRAKLLYGTGC